MNSRNTPSDWLIQKWHRTCGELDQSREWNASQNSAENMHLTQQLSYPYSIGDMAAYQPSYRNQQFNTAFNVNQNNNNNDISTINNNNIGQSSAYNEQYLPNYYDTTSEGIMAEQHQPHQPITQHLQQLQPHRRRHQRHRHHNNNFQQQSTSSGSLFRQHSLVPSTSNVPSPLLPGIAASLWHQVPPTHIPQLQPPPSPLQQQQSSSTENNAINMMHQNNR